MREVCPQLATVSLVINFKQKNKKDGRSGRERNGKKRKTMRNKDWNDKRSSRKKRIQMKGVEKVEESREQGMIIFWVPQHETDILDCKEDFGA